MALTDMISNAVKRDIPKIALDENLRTAIAKLIEADTLSLVVMNGEEFIGILTDMDVMRSVANNEDLETTKVSQVMTACELITKREGQSPCVQLDDTETVAMALGVMELAGVHNLLVSGADDQPVGVVSVKDLLKLAIA